jgi:hypothetical protein
MILTPSKHTHEEASHGSGAAHGPLGIFQPSVSFCDVGEHVWVGIAQLALHA